MVWPEGRVAEVVPVSLLILFFISAFIMMAAAAIHAYGQGLVIVEPRDGSSSPPPPPPCDLSITSMKISSLKWKGHERSNPDGSYYPDDAFRVTIGISEKHCTDIRYQIKGGDGLDIACDDCRSSNVHISSSASPGTYTVRAVVRADGQGGDDSDSESLNIRVIDPVITVKVIPANVTDSDGYLMRNADGTYYVNDAVALMYEVDYRFKDERRGIIEPEVTRVHPYPHIADLDCLLESCTLVVPRTSATSEYRAQHAYATGISVANATGQQGLGQKEFRFDVRLKNAGAFTGMEKTYTHVVSIVDYRPVFAGVYPYLNLKDDVGSDMYERRLTVGAHYLGSADASDGTVKPLRRAKVNYYANNVTALVVGSGQMDITRDAKLTWLNTESYGNPGSVVVLSTAQGKSAVIEREGYVKFVSMMLGYVPNTGQWIRTANLTAWQTFYSVNFGGKSSTELFSVSYRYPDARLSNSIITVNARDENNYTVDKPVRITVDLRPPGTVSICDYYEKHALHSTGGDANIAAMARSDVYSCGDGDNGSVITVTGTGTAFALVNATSIVPPSEMPFYGAVYPGGIDAMPPQLVLSMPYYLSIRVSVDDVTKDYSVPLYDSSGAYNVRVMANVGQNNALVAERAGGGASEVVHVRPADSELFGIIDAIEVSGKGVACQPPGGLLTCTLIIPREATIVATNEWGGRASTAVSAPVVANPTVRMTTPVTNDLSTVTMVLVAVAAAFVSTALFRKWISWTGDAFT
ncbi:MAG TPA: hypothetical protein VF172_03055 [Nitrososphaera sp.]|jgi:hypothetical protein